MGWASGSELAKRVAKSAQQHITDPDERKAFYQEMIEAFEEFDCDTLYEIVEFDDNADPLLVEALQESWES